MVVPRFSLYKTLTAKVRHEAIWRWIKEALRLCLSESPSTLSAFTLLPPGRQRWEILPYLPGMIMCRLCTREELRFRGAHNLSGDWLLCVSLLLTLSGSLFLPCCFCLFSLYLCTSLSLPLSLVTSLCVSLHLSLCLSVSVFLSVFLSEFLCLSFSLPVPASCLLSPSLLESPCWSRVSVGAPCSLDDPSVSPSSVPRWKFLRPGQLQTSQLL